jgi:hypothetical protein
MEPTFYPYRKRAGNKAAVIFVHGFSGKIEQTWGHFPALLVNDQRLDGWDIVGLGYPTSLTLDLPGIWEADPSNRRLPISCTPG